MTAVPGSTAVIEFADGTRVPVTWNSDGRFWQSQALGRTWSPLSLGGLDAILTDIEPPQPVLPIEPGSAVQARLHKDEEPVVLYRTASSQWVTCYGIWVDDSRLIDPVPMTLVPTEVVRSLVSRTTGDNSELATQVASNLGSRL
jgi:hypothetical protein